MNIIKGKENENIKNNFIYLSRDIVEHCQLNQFEENLLKLTNTRNSNYIYTSWKGGILENKESLFEFSSNFSKDKNINEEYFYIEIVPKNDNALSNLSLVPCSNEDYKQIEYYSDFFEENLLNQINVVYQNEIIPFYFSFDNKYAYFKVQIDSDFGIVSDECEINIQYVPPKQNVIEKSKEINDKEDEFIIDSFKKKQKDLFNYTENLIYLCLKEDSKKEISRLCDESSIDNTNILNDTFPYKIGFWLGKIHKDINNKGTLPLFTIINCAIYQNDLLIYKTMTYDSVIKNKSIYNEYLIKSLRIEFFSNSKSSVDDFKLFLVTKRPLVLTQNFIYNFENYIFSVKLSAENESQVGLFTIYPNFPIILNDEININSIRVYQSQELLVNYNYTIFLKKNRYLQIENPYYFNIPKILKSFHKKEIISKNIETIIYYIDDYFNNKNYHNALLISFANKINILSYYEQIFKKIMKQNVKYEYINLEMFDYNYISKEKYKKIINYFKNLQEHLTNNISQKKLILVQGSDSLLRITNTSSSNNEDTNFIMNQNQNEMLYKMSRSFSKLLKYVQRNPNNFIIISFRGNNPITSFEFIESQSYLPRFTINENLSEAKLQSLSKQIENLPILKSILIQKKELTFSDIITIVQNPSKIITNQDKKETESSYDFSSVCNMNEIKEKINDLLTLSKEYSSCFSGKKLPIKLSKGCLLIGPSGCGKTYIAKAIEKEFHINFISIKSPDILGKYIGQSETSIRQIFQKAKENPPTILFFDEIDTLTPVRGCGSSGVTDRIVNQFLTYLDGVDEREDIFVIGATSNPNLVDPAMMRPGRLDTILFCDYPTKEEKKNATLFFLEKIGKKMDFRHFESVIDNICMEFFTYADIYMGVYNAFLLCVKKSIEKNKGKELLLLEEKDLVEGFQQIKKKINLDEIQLYNSIRKQIHNKKNIEMPKNPEPSSKQTFI